MVNKMDKYVSYKIDAEESLKKFISLVKVFRESSLDIIIEMSLTIASSIRNGNTIYCCGNGGSAADSQHIAGEFIGRFLLDRKPLPFVSLNADTSVLTCLGNDFGFDNIFSRQIEGLGRKGDVLIVFSTSGTSKNIVKAAETAKKNGLKVLSFTGKKGTHLEKMSDICLCSSTEETYLAQQIHQLAYHMICKFVEENINSGT
ncbi:MAG: SIS domain-containing protein [Actinobacteria bacterium]|nr:SIS domain-containing protein [Actinomycetota bacterium]